MRRRHAAKPVSLSNPPWTRNLDRRKTCIHVSLTQGKQVPLLLACVQNARRNMLYVCMYVQTRRIDTPRSGTPGSAPAADLRSAGSPAPAPARVGCRRRRRARAWTWLHRARPRSPPPTQAAWSRPGPPLPPAPPQASTSVRTYTAVPIPKSEAWPQANDLAVAVIHRA
jgi:hypothetical protein